MTHTQTIPAVIFDWAGTVVDFGCHAPVEAFVNAFAAHGVTITPAHARAPMGKAKWEHIQAIGQIPEIAEAWTKRHGHPMTDADVDQIYAGFLPFQVEAIGNHMDLIDGAVGALKDVRERGAKVGSTTGYPRDILNMVMGAARQQGFETDTSVGAGETSEGRPQPFMIYKALLALEASPAWACVNVDDTPVGVQAGRNAGLWCIGITVSGNEVGLSQAEWNNLPQDGQEQLRRQAGHVLTEAGAHIVIDSVADLPRALDDIQARMAGGERP